MELGSDYHLDAARLRKCERSALDYFDSLGVDRRRFDSGRSAIRALLSLLPEGGVLLPEYVCESVIEAFKPRKITFYKLLANLEIDEDDLVRKLDGGAAAVFVTHYFGKKQARSVLERISRRLGRTVLIEDATHGVFTDADLVGDFGVASLRKWLPIPDGGFLYSKTRSLGSASYPRAKVNERVGAMTLKTLYLNGALDCVQEYREMFRNAERALDAQKEVAAISEFSERLLECFDVERLVAARRENFARLEKRLKKIGVAPLFELDDKICPLVFPTTVSNRDRFRAYLTKKKIYCAVHWPFAGGEKTERPTAVAMANRMISFPIDQRYGRSETDYLADAIEDYGGFPTC